MNTAKLILFLLFVSSQIIQAQKFLKGADLSFANEIQGSECNITFKKKASDNFNTDIYKIFKDYGCNVVRARLWYGDTNPVSGTYSTIADVKKTFIEAKKNSAWVKTLLTIHYSDSWADPNHQKTPSEWLSVTGNNASTALKQKVTDYTNKVIDDIGKGRIDYISIGNETNPGIMCPQDIDNDGDSTNDNRCREMGQTQSFSRMKELIQTGIDAARNKGFQKKHIMVHVAGPGHAEWWLSNMKVGRAGGLNNFGLIGLSYYPSLNVNERGGHNMSTSDVGRIFRNIIGKYRIRPLIVETSHPYTKSGTSYDKVNRMNVSSSYESFSNISNPTIKHQKDFMTNLTNQVYSAGGLGVLSWEPAWVSPAQGKTNCTSTSFGYGSDQEHHTFFTNDSNHSVIANGGIQFMDLKKNYNILGLREVTFRLNITNIPAGQKPFIAFDFDSNDAIDYDYWFDERVEMTWSSTSQAWEVKLLLREGRTYKYKYQQRYEPIYTESFNTTDSDCVGTPPFRNITVWNSGNQVVTNWYGTCYNSQSSSKSSTLKKINQNNENIKTGFSLFPNPANNLITIKANKKIKTINVEDLLGKQYATYIVNHENFDVDVSALQKGIYIVSIDTGVEKITKKLVIQ